MADIKIRDEPAFSIRMEALDPLDPVHADFYNIRFRQLLENDAFIKGQADGIKEITADEIISMYGSSTGTGDIGDAEIGIAPGDIDEMYSNDVAYSIDTGIPNGEIEGMYNN